MSNQSINIWLFSEDETIKKKFQVLTDKFYLFKVNEIKQIYSTTEFHENIESLQDCPILVDLKLGLQNITQIFLELFNRFPKGRPLVMAFGENVNLDIEQFCFLNGMSDCLDVPRLTPKGLERAIKNALLKRQNDEKLLKLQAQLHHNAKLASIGTLSAGVAHELNNPITALLGFLFLLQQKGENPEEREKLIGKIESTTMRMRNIINGLLAYSRGTQNLSSEKICLNELIQYVYSFMGILIEKSGIEIELELNPNLKEIWCDKDKISSLIQNLLSNAMDALNETDKIEKKIIIRTDNAKDENYILLDVIDNGPGIPDEVQDKMFDPFFTTKVPGKGTGLGMGIINGVLQDHHAKLNFETNEKSGTHFKIELPIDRRAVKRSNEELEKFIAGDKGHKKQDKPHILLVDDDHLILEALEIILSEQFHVTAFQDAKQACQKLPTHFDMALVDYKMTSMTGFEFVRYLRQERPDPTIKVVMITGRENEEIVKNYKSAGADELIFKPIENFDRLILNLKEILKIKE